jgi:hypothetical protein
MSKHPLNGSHIDLDEISMVGPLKRGPNGNWLFGVQWKRTGQVGNIDATPEADPDKRFDLTDIDSQKPAALAAYRAFLSAWYGTEQDDKIIPISELAVPPAAPTLDPIIRP